MIIALLLAAVGCLAMLIYLIIFFSLHFLPTGYNPIRHAVSDYAVGKYGRLFRSGLWINSLGILALSAGLWLGVGAPPLARLDLIFLLLVVVTRIGMTFFPTDIEGQGLTRTGIIHYVFAILSFAFLYSAISGLTPVLQTLPPWQSIKDILNILQWIVLVSLVLVVVTMFRPLRRIFGLIERVFLLSSNIWILLVGVLLFIKLV